jgi:hypothetical protein
MRDLAVEQRSAEFPHGLGLTDTPAFLTPSYLRNSRYIARLETCETREEVTLLNLCFSRRSSCACLRHPRRTEPGGLTDTPAFLTPSYLRNSRYIARLETAHRAKIAAQPGILARPGRK